jgi:hypothetical protein
MFLLADHFVNEFLPHRSPHGSSECHEDAACRQFCVRQRLSPPGTAERSEEAIAQQGESLADMPGSQHTDVHLQSV